jgi:hypothetical protein
MHTPDRGRAELLARAEAEIHAVAMLVPCSGFRLQALGRTPHQLAERCGGLAPAFHAHALTRLSVAPSAKWGLERETGLEPATFSLEGSDHLQR